MEILFVRHAIAGLRDAEKWPDDRDRPLTPKGAAKFRRMARELRSLFPMPQAVWSSPLARAWQTAEILVKEAGWPAPAECGLLTPEAKPEALIPFLRRQRSIETAVVIGHEPHLHEAISVALAGSAELLRVEMKKGGAAGVRFPEEVLKGGGELTFLLPPRALRRR